MYSHPWKYTGRVGMTTLGSVTSYTTEGLFGILCRCMFGAVGADSVVNIITRLCK